MTTLAKLSSLLIFIAPFSYHGQIVSTLLDSSIDRITDALILDDEGNLYGADYAGDKVYILSPDGELSVFAEGFGAPNGLAFDSNGNLFVCDNTGNRIYTLDPEGNFIDTVIVSSPSGILKELDSDTMIFTQYTGNTLNKLSPDGVITQTHSAGVLNGPVGLAYDSEEKLFVGNFNDREIYEVDGPDLNYIATVPGPTSGRLGFIAFGGGVLWGTSFQGDKVYQIEQNYMDSVVLYAGSVAGNMDGPIAEATFNNPNGIITNAAGDSIYLSQYPGGEIRLISPDLVGSFEYYSSPTKVYPNPAEEEILMKTEKAFDHIEVFDLLGNLVYEKTWADKLKNRTLSIIDLRTGIYFLRLQDGSITIAEQKIVKR